MREMAEAVSQVVEERRAWAAMAVQGGAVDLVAPADPLFILRVRCMIRMEIATTKLT